MRIGRNPLSSSKVPTREPIVCAVITHLPNDYQMYHKHRWPIIDLSLQSLRKHANVDIHLAIWDNGSHPDFRTWLKDEIKPDTLVLSPNVGKSIARKALFGMFEPETLMAVADDDIFYFPNWLRAQIELFRHFDDADPKVGIVTGYPVRTSYRWANESAKAFAEKYGKLEEDKFIEQEWDYDYCTSIGREYQDHLQLSANVREFRVTYRGRQALTVGHHCQFICINGRIAPFLRWDAGAMADEKPFDLAVDSAYMRLCTTERLTMHMGNVLDGDDKLLALARRYDLAVPGNKPAGIVRGGRASVAAVASAPIPTLEFND